MRDLCDDPYSDTTTEPAIDADELDTTVRCLVCGRTKLINWRAALADDDWPLCHGHPMETIATRVDPGRVARGG